MLTDGHCRIIALLCRQAVSTAMRSHLASNLLAVTLYSVPEAGMEARIALQAAVTDLLHHNAEAGTLRTRVSLDYYSTTDIPQPPESPLTARRRAEGVK